MYPAISAVLIEVNMEKIMDDDENWLNDDEHIGNQNSTVYWRILIVDDECGRTCISNWQQWENIDSIFFIEQRRPSPLS